MDTLKDAKKVSVTGAGHLWEDRDAKFVLELTKRGFCEGGLSRAVQSAYESVN